MALVILLVAPGWHWWSSWWSLGGPWGVGVGEVLPANHCEFRNNLLAISGSATGGPLHKSCRCEILLAGLSKCITHILGPESPNPKP